jgi:hypothetical protein
VDRICEGEFAITKMHRAGVVSIQQLNLYPCNGTAHFDLRQARRVLSSVSPGWGTLISNQFSNPASRRKCLRLF